MTDSDTIKTLWVDPIHGDNAYPGKIAEYPFRTLQHALATCEDGTVIYLLLPSDYLNRKIVVVVTQETG